MAIIDLVNIDMKKLIKWSLIIFVGFFVLMGIIGSSSKDAQKSFEAGKKAGSGESQAEKLNVIVESQIVKKVDGKYRYFFDIRNKDTKNFEGSVTITVYNNLQESSLGGDTFKTSKPIEPNLGTSVYFDIFTGPASVHGENGITKFKYVVKKDDQTVNEGEGTISTKLENLSY